MAVLQSTILKFSSYCRCITIARFTTSTYCNKQSLEEKLGLTPRPKKPTTPFFRFIANIKPEVLQQQPNIKPTELAKIAAERWKKIDENSKDDLKKQYEKDLLRYQVERKEYEQNLSPSDRDMITLEKENKKLRKEKDKLKKRKEELGRPKKPAPPFILFMKSQLTERGNSAFKEWFSRLAKGWNSLPEQEKAPYLERHRREMEEYKRKLSKWEKDMIRQGFGSLVSQHQSKLHTD